MNSVWVTSWLCGLVATLGCGSVGNSGPIDARSDAPPDAPAVCAPDGAFDPPVLVPGFGTGVVEAAAHFSPDELNMYFAANYPDSAGAFDLYLASRSKITDPFGKPANLTVLNTTASDADPSVGVDELTVVFYSNRVANEGLHIYVATRSSPLAQFGKPELLGGVAAPAVTSNDATPFLTADGQELWFSSDRGGNYDVWRASRAGAGFANPQAVLALNTANREILPVVSADRLTVYFTTERGAATQAEDIWFAHRATLADEFSAPRPVPSINTVANDHPSWLSPDNCRLYITSNVAGTDDLYVATRHPP